MLFAFPNISPHPQLIVAEQMILFLFCFIQTAKKQTRRERSECFDELRLGIPKTRGSTEKLEAKLLTLL